MITLRQKARNDRKDAWWKRAQWAMDRTLRADAGERQLGYEALAVLGRYRGATREDKQVLLAAVRRALDHEPDE